MKLKPYPEYKDSGVPWLGEIPAHWNVIRSGHLFQEVVDTNHPDLDLLSIMMDKGIILQSESGRKTRASEDRSTYKKIQPGQLGYNLMNAFMGSIGISKYEGILSPAYAVAKPRFEVEPWYFHYLFRTPIYLEVFDSYSYGIMYERNRLYYERFKLIYSSLPPLEEQKAIVEYIKFISQKINHFIRNKRSLIKLLNEQKQVIINQTVTRGLDPNVSLKSSDVHYLGVVPEHWEVWKLGYLAWIGNGSTPLRSNINYWQFGDYPWLNSSVVNRETISDSDQFVTSLALQQCHLPKVKPGSVLVGITGQGKTRGMAALLEIEATISQHIAYITPKGKRLSSQYLYWFLKALYTALRTMSQDSGSTKEALTCQDIKNIRIALPSLQEQKAIDLDIRHSLEKVDAAITRIQNEIELIQEYRTRLISDVVIGKIDVRDIEIPALSDEDVVEDLEDEELLEEAEAELEEDGNTDE